MKRNIILTLAVLALSTSVAWGQTIRSLGVYDNWAESPFMTGQMQGNIAYTENPYADKDNPSKVVIGFQRSRFGSNTFGALLELDNTFELTPQYKYVHVKIYKPVEGRTMLIGLGKRQNRAGQSPRAEQFWAYSSEPVPADCWVDAVFPVKGNGGIDIHSLVVVPDCESPHYRNVDFAVYISDIEVSDNPQPRFVCRRMLSQGSAATDTNHCRVTANNRNGDVLAADGSDLSAFPAEPFKPFKIKMRPSRGFSYDGIRIHYAGNEKWVPKTAFDTSDCYTIPAECMTGDVIIDGEFVEKK